MERKIKEAIDRFEVILINLVRNAWGIPLRDSETLKGFSGNVLNYSKETKSNWDRR